VPVNSGGSKDQVEDARGVNKRRGQEGKENSQGLTMASIFYSTK